MKELVVFAVIVLLCGCLCLLVLLPVKNFPHVHENCGEFLHDSTRAAPPRNNEGIVVDDKSIREKK